MAGGGELAGRGGDVEGVGEAGGEGGVVGVEGEGVAEFAGGLFVNEVEGATVGVLLTLQEPGGDLGAAVREGDAVELVFNDGGGFGGGRRRWAGRGCWRRRAMRRRAGAMPAATCGDCCVAAAEGGWLGEAVWGLCCLRKNWRPKKTTTMTSIMRRRAAVVLAAACAALLTGVGELWHGFVYLDRAGGRQRCGAGVGSARLLW